MICTDTEHEHTSACYSNPEADKESKENWEQTIKDVKLTSVWADDVLAIAESQLGYEESTSNYILDEAGKKKGYSRYGDWYGNAYGDWCAMFVSFCIHYADIPTSESTAVTDENGRKIYMPISAGCQNWIELMNRSETPYYYAVDDKNSYNLINDSSDFEPEAGNLIFFNWDSEPDADHVGLVIEVERNKKDEITQIKTIEGNSSNKVKYNTYSPDNKNIMGYAVIPVNPNEIRPEEIAEAESESETESEQNEDQAEPELSGADAEVAEDSEIAAEAETITEAEEAEDAETTVEAEKAENAETTVEAEEAETRVESEEAEDAETRAETEETENAETPAEAEEEAENESTADAEPEEGAETTEEAVEPETEETVEEERITRIYDGADFHITLTYEATAGIPAAAEVEVRELMGEEYNKACQEAMEAMGITEIIFARFFDITFVMNGEEIEPTGSVEVQIAYDEVIELNEDEIAKAVHFAEDGTEVLDMQEEHTEEGTVLIFEQESFSTTGTVYGISTLAEDDGVSLQAATSDPPAIGSSITAINVQSPEVGKWYIIYGVCPSDSSAGYAMIANNCTYQTMLGQFSTDYGTVTYTGSDDVAWEYTENGFRNRSGQYLVLRYTSGTSSDMSLESSSYSGGVHYSYDYKILYETENVWINYRRRVRYNEVYMHTWLTNGQYRNTGEAYTSLAYVAQEEANKRNVFIAEIQESQVGGTRHPRGSVTGTPGAADLVLYNIDGSDETTRTLAGVEYTIYDQEGNIVQSLKTTENFVLKLQPLADGTYTVKQTGVPDGYIVYAQEKTFTVKDGFGFIGIFYDYKDDSIPKVNDKTAEVVDYENRTYRIEIGAQSVEYSYDMEAINYELVVDQSNSMLFPSELTAVKYNGSNVTVTLKNTTSSGENGKALNQLVAQGKIDINKVYYVIANEETTSTVYAIWHDGNGWCYQDAAYYSKAQMHENRIEHNATEGNGFVHYAEAGKGYSITYSDNTIAYGGGGLDYYGKDSSGNYYSVGGNLGNDVGSSGRSLILYEGSYYNRLHDLQEAVMVFGGQV